MFTLEIKKRNPSDGSDALRESGMIPAVFYGKKAESTPITISNAEFSKVYKKAGESSIVHLKGEGMDVQAIIHDLDLHPVTNRVRHVDFYVFESDKNIKVDVALEFVGVSPAVKDFGAVLVKVIHSLEIEALPKDLPQHLDVDISSLTSFDSVITAKDIKLPAGVSLAVEPTEIIASVYEPKEEVEEAAPVDLSSIEVAKKGKEAKEGEGEVEAEAKK